MRQCRLSILSKIKLKESAQQLQNVAELSILSKIKSALKLIIPNRYSSFNSIQDQGKIAMKVMVNYLKHFQFYPRSSPTSRLTLGPWGSIFQFYPRSSSSLRSRSSIIVSNFQFYPRSRTGLFFLKIPLILPFNSIQDQALWHVWQSNHRLHFQFYPRSSLIYPHPGGDHLGLSILSKIKNAGATKLDIDDGLLFQFYPRSSKIPPFQGCNPLLTPFNSIQDQDC